MVKITERTKILKGSFICPYKVFKIKFPYSMSVYIYAGPPAEAEKFAKKLTKEKEWKHKYKIKEIKL